MRARTSPVTGWREPGFTMEFANRRQIALNGLVKVLLAGASGFVGRPLRAALEQQGFTIVTLARPDQPREPGSTYWNPLVRVASAEVIKVVESCDAVIHVSGENIAAQPWTPELMTRIRDSRVASTEQLSHAIARAEHKPRCFLSASATGYYGDRGDEELTEASGPGNLWISKVCKDWEAATLAAPCRKVQMRFGVVLGTNGGALAKMIPPFKWGLGGRFGRGRQWMSWISLEDAVAAQLHVLKNEAVSGPVNLVSPTPCTNREFTAALGRALIRPAFLPIPKFVLRKKFGKQMTQELFLSSQRVMPEVLQKTGFEFNDREIQPALKRILS
jgi:uncharacterized protein (TIGR01777 family)